MTTVNAELLRELHRIHRQLTDLNARFERGPRQIKAAEATVEKLQADVDAAKKLVTRNKVATDEKDLQLRERENRIAEVKAKLNAASSNREYQAFVEQIAADDQANNVLSDEILELMEKTTELEKGVEVATGNLKKGNDELAAVKKRVEETRDNLQADIERLTIDLKEAETKLPMEFKTDYQRVVKKRGEDALAPLDGECCGGCFQMVTPQMQTEIRMLKPIFCRSCGCLLYLPE